MAKEPRPSRHQPVPPLEWAAAAVGLIVALALVGTILWHALASSSDAVPVIEVEAGRLVRSPHGHVVEFELANRSSATAASVQVEGVLKRGAARAETATATVDYVPGHSKAAGGLVFSEDPRRHALELRVTGYELP